MKGFLSTPLRVFGAVALMVAALAAPQPSAADAPVPYPLLISDVRGAWVEGQDQWVNLSWTAHAELEDVEVSASSTATDVAISYPDPTATGTGLQNDPDLASNEIDMTPMYVSTSTASPDAFRIDLDVSWSYRGIRYHGEAALWYDVVRLTNGDHTSFASLTTTVDIPASGDGSRNWVSLDFLGMTHTVTDFKVRLEGDLPVHYPQENHTSLHHDVVLQPNETDTARVWFDPERIEPGTYEMIITVDYQEVSVGGDLAQAPPGQPAAGQTTPGQSRHLVVVQVW